MLSSSKKNRTKEHDSRRGLDYVPSCCDCGEIIEEDTKALQCENVWILKRGSVRDVWMSVTNFMTSLCHPANVTFTGFVAVVKLLLLTLK